MSEKAEPLTGEDDILEVMFENYVDGDFGYFKETEIAATLWERIQATIAALHQRLAAAEGVVADALSVITDAPELNPSNYDHEQACDLNAAMCEAYAILGTYRKDYPQDK